MYYLALLIGPQQERTPDEAAQELTDYLNFQAKAASSIRAGDALYPEADSVRVTGGPDAPVITDGPFAEAPKLRTATTFWKRTILMTPWHWPAISRKPSAVLSRYGRWSTAHGNSAERAPRAGSRCCWSPQTARMCRAARNGKPWRPGMACSARRQVGISKSPDRCTPVDGYHDPGA